ncbi:LysR family transcriptional regulator [Micromonospora siamensis]|uniref:DNA-binding transcriptional regulator, LysR family n=1 Tax=Micromonospora siamensis TaxID=299152 RepID=A0A1C5JTQ5_9ACTN|nr:LysR family transcriptional regulator [Micromonospora siamensis]SCG73942.1 DNA-binding transcriptional regulator, LysR family [Micromonospora siamensis]
MDLNRVRAFVVTAELRSFTRAAQELGLAQPSLSARVRALEAELGVELFSRARRQVELTDAGREFLDHAQRLLAAADEAVRSTARAAGGATGRRMALTTLAASIDEGKAGVVVALRRRAPQLRVTLSGVPFADHVRAVRDGRADAAYVWPPYTAATLAGLHVEPLRDHPRLLAVADRHPLARAGAVRVDDLAGLPQVPLPDDVDPVFVAAWRLVPAPPLAAVAPAPTVAALLDAVAADAGCAPVPAPLAATAATPGVSFVPIDDAPPATLALAWRRDAAGPAHALLHDVARELLAG